MTSATLFEQAVDALVHGDVGTLKALLTAQPALATARSSRRHEATLLHYVAANGVEDERQRTPANIVEIAQALLKAGAMPDATANIYGGGAGSTPLVLLVTSAHPARAGQQGDLVKVLVNGGASATGIHDDNLPLYSAILARNIRAIRALIRGGARVDNLVYAVAAQQPAQVEAFIVKPAPLYTHADEMWVRDAQALLNYALPVAGLMGDVQSVALLLDAGANINAAQAPLHATALQEAAMAGHLEVVRVLLARGADVSLQDNQGFTPLHAASWNGHLEVIDLLLAHNAALEARNNYGGTVLDTTVHAIINTHYGHPRPLQTVQKLLAAGADANAVSPYPTGRDELDRALAQYRV